ncbi:hypothetical protein PVAP13_5KG718501 [Panicum virgatum]|uniref:Uncharacterized protein n=1 Tax=Panicum virgatum TaxID=38727 RepID=A0A8T0SW39_PANVG|nr:hypothetical protein PVAP13_5KG718501 [Panicum virgatum]
MPHERRVSRTPTPCSRRYCALGPTCSCPATPSHRVTCSPAPPIWRRHGRHVRPRRVPLRAARLGAGAGRRGPTHGRPRRHPPRALGLRPASPSARCYGAWAVVTGATDGIGCGRARPPPSCFLSPRQLPSPSLHGRGRWGTRARRGLVRRRRGCGRDHARALELGVHSRVRRASASMGGGQG